MSKIRALALRRAVFKTPGRDHHPSQEWIGVSFKTISTIFDSGNSRNTIKKFTTV